MRLATIGTLGAGSGPAAARRRAPWRRLCPSRLRRGGGRLLLRPLVAPSQAEIEPAEAKREEEQADQEPGRSGAVVSEPGDQQTGDGEGDHDRGEEAARDL